MLLSLGAVGWESAQLVLQCVLAETAFFVFACEHVLSECASPFPSLNPRSKKQESQTLRSLSIPNSGSATLLVLQGPQTNIPQAWQLTLSLATCASDLLVEAQVNSLWQAVHLEAEWKGCQVGAEDFAPLTLLTSRRAS